MSDTRPPSFPHKISVFQKFIINAEKEIWVELDYIEKMEKDLLKFHASSDIYI